MIKGSEAVETVKETNVRTLKGTIILNVIVAFIGYFIFENPIAFIYGIFFGGTIAFLNFRLLYLTLVKAVRMQPHQAQAYAASRYMIRMVITGIVLYVSIKSEQLNTIGTLAGLFSIKLVILKTELFSNRQFFFNIFKRKEDK